MSRIIIQMGGGLIRDVFKTGKGEPKEVVVVDLEVESDELSSSSPDRITNYIDTVGEPAQCIIQDFGFTKLPKSCDVVRSIKAWDKNWKKKAKNG